MYGHVTKTTSLSALRRQADNEWRLQRAAALITEAKRLEHENPFSIEASKLYAKAEELRKGLK